MNRFIIDHLVLAALIVCVSIALLVFPINPLVGSILYFGLPSAYLVFKRPCIFKYAIVPSLIFGFLYGIGFEYINEVSGSWFFPLESTFVLPSLFFEIVPGDVIVWYILWIFMIISYYEYFINRHTVCRFLRRRIYKALGLGFLALGIIALAEYGFKTSIIIPYAYTITGLAALIPAYILYKRKPRLFPKLARTIPFLGAFFLIMEVIALSVGYWEFSGGSIFTIMVAGHLFPIEELVFWIILSPLVISAYYELFLDDER